MSGRAVIVGLIDAGATRVTVARAVMVVAGVLLSVTAWGAASAWADTPVQWRIVAGSLGGTAFGSDQTLTTPPVFGLGGQQPEPTVSTLTTGESDFTAEFSATVNPRSWAPSTSLTPPPIARGWHG